MPRTKRVTPGGMVYHVLNRGVGRMTLFEDYNYQVLRYIERNALRANLVERAEDWRWCSLSPWRSSEPDESWSLARPLPCGPGWTEHVNQPQTEAEIAAIRGAIRRGSPLGSQSWIESTARRLGLESTLRPRGRPRQNESRGQAHS